MVRGICNCYISFWIIFSPFTPRTAQKNQNFEKIKKTPADMITLHISPINYYQMMYASWDVVINTYNYFSFGTIFFSFTLLTGTKLKFLKNGKKSGDIIIINMCAKNHDHMMYGFFILGHFLPFCPPNSSKRINFEKTKETPAEFVILHTCTKNYDQMMYIS